MQKVKDAAHEAEVRSQPRPQWGLPLIRLRKRTRRTPIVDVVTIVVVLVIVLAATIGPMFSPDVYTSHITESLQSPSGSHWFGTDEQGRDVFWRIIAGARVTVSAAIGIVLGYALIGSAIAALAAIGPRWVDEALMRFTDLGLAFPSLIFALAIASALGASLTSAIVALLVTGWPLTARLLRGVMKETMAATFVEGATVLGVGKLRLMVRHVLPNAVPPLIVKWAGDIGNTILVIGALSFIGAGAQPPSPEWGAMVASARGFVSTAWWTAFFPGLMIATATAAFGLLGDMLQVRQDPSLRR